MDFRAAENWRVAKPRVPNVLCGKCGTRFTWKQVKDITHDYITKCKNCGTFMDCFSVNVEVRADNEYLLHTTPRYWWHITERADWANNRNLKARYVHVGTQQTCRVYHDILVHNRDWKNVFQSTTFIDPGLHLYRVELPPQVRVHPKLAIDHNNWPVEVEGGGPPVICKYVNQVEVPGSISLLVPYRDLTNIREVSNFGHGRNNPDYKEA